jgi:hypothetical protein
VSMLSPYFLVRNERGNLLASAVGLVKKLTCEVHFNFGALGSIEDGVFF